MDRVWSDLKQYQLDPKLAQNQEAWRKAVMAIDPGRVIFSTLVPGSGSFQLSDLVGYGLGLMFWVVFTIIVCVFLTLTLITTITVILP